LGLREKVASEISCTLRKGGENQRAYLLRVAGAILSLPIDEVITLGDLLRMWENEILMITVDETNPASIADACSEQFDKAMRARGWMHKDDPVEGFEVKEKCRICGGIGSWPDTGFSRRPCTACKAGTISRPLTLGELPERVRKMKKALKKIDEISFLDNSIPSPQNTIIMKIINDALKEGQDEQ
jgi:hypothetical protein